MFKFLNIFAAILIVPIFLLAEGPVFHHKETEKQQEFENVYSDLRKLDSGKYIVNVGSNGTVQVFNVSSGTVSGDFNIAGLLTCGSFATTSFSVTSFTASVSTITGNLNVGGLLVVPSFIVSNATITGNAFIRGTSTNDSATPGNVGEYISTSASTGGIDITTTTSYQNFLSTSLSAGDWDVSGTVEIAANGATYTAVAAAISLFSGNTTTDHVTGTNAITSGTNGVLDAITIPTYRISLASNSTVYLKGRATFTAGNPQLSRGHLAARRAR